MIGLAQNTPYGGTKGWIHAFMRGVAVEQAQNGVRANCVCPGPIDTAWTHKETGPIDKEMEKSLIQAVPLARRGTPEEVANVYVFLASDEASYVTGALYVVDKGTTIAKGPVGDLVPQKLRKEPKGKLTLNIPATAFAPRRRIESSRERNNLPRSRLPNSTALSHRVPFVIC